MNVLLPIWTALRFVLGDTAPNLEGFEDVAFMFVGLWQMFLPLILVLVVIGAFIALFAKFSPGTATKIGRIFRF